MNGGLPGGSSGRSWCYAPVCQPGQCGGQHGWRVPYTRAFRPLIVFYVTDLADGATYSGFLPFIIDTGSPRTLVPRHLLPSYAFRPAPLTDSELSDVSGTPIVGHVFDAALSLSPRQPACDALRFPRMPIFVAGAQCRIGTGLLGMDALRQIVTVADATQVCFYQPLARGSSVASRVTAR
jgi:hypothetical protein